MMGMSLAVHPLVAFSCWEPTWFGSARCGYLVCWNRKFPKLPTCTRVGGSRFCSLQMNPRNSDWMNFQLIPCFDTKSYAHSHDAVGMTCLSSKRFPPQAWMTAEKCRWFAFPISQKWMEMFPLSSLNPDRALKKPTGRAAKNRQWSGRGETDMNCGERPGDKRYPVPRKGKFRNVLEWHERMSILTTLRPVNGSLSFGGLTVKTLIIQRHKRLGCTELTCEFFWIQLVAKIWSCSPPKSFWAKFKII